MSAAEAGAAAVLNTPDAWSTRAATIDDPCEVVRWSPQGQAARFAEILRVLRPRPGETLLDYGCGLGALSDLLPDDVGYLGFDWSPGMVRRARRERPGREFTTFLPFHPFNLIAVVGTFNLADRWTKDRTWSIIRHLWLTTGCRSLAASLYAGEDPDCLSYTVEECNRFVIKTSSVGQVRRWRDNDILLEIGR